LIHRQMRARLLETFDKIYILDLHGNSARRETAPDGSPDHNVFDIKQGVSINFFVKSNKKKKGAPADVLHCDLFGARQRKYDFLWKRDLSAVEFKKLQTPGPDFFFVPKDLSARAEFETGFGVQEIFAVFNSGIQSKRDALFINSDKAALAENIQTLLSGEFDDDFAAEYQVADSSGYKMTRLIKGAQFDFDNIVKINYRPFDAQWVYYDKNLLGRASDKVMRHMLAGDNLGLITVRQVAEHAFNHVLVADGMVDLRITTSNKGTGYLFPLYLYPDAEQIRLDGEAARKPNLNAGIVQQIAGQLGLRFVAEKSDDADTFAPVDILDYIYAALHSPAYRNKFREFLKIDFPRVPYPRDREHFRALAKLGAELRALHLMTSSKLEKVKTSYPHIGDNTVTAVVRENQNVWINKTQCFVRVPQTAWDFYIGGYQPAKKYLKDRKGRTLTWDEIHHYQKIIAALVETAKAMDKIDAVA